MCALEVMNTGSNPTCDMIGEVESQLFITQAYKKTKVPVNNQVISIAEIK